MGSPRVGDGTRADVCRRIRGRGGGRRNYSRREFCRVRMKGTVGRAKAGGGAGREFR